ncbi:GNAT family N-acetyltransferase [Lysinibacillus sp. KU-BSD001]|uniref:GNAT family N-acetyltransferase n=1 Tax=Lysinibacillus sp. KU-BSD001 TaxID=3141328 RepID=UPI0036E9B9AD
MEIQIEKATIADFQAVNAIVKEGHNVHVEALPYLFKNVQKVMLISYYQQLLEDEASDILIATENATIVGFAIISLESSPPFESLVPRKFAYINDFGVKTVNQRKGIGKKLFEACIAWAKEKDVQSVELNVWEFNQSAISFYESLGMKSMSRKMNLMLE